MLKSVAFSLGYNSSLTYRDEECHKEILNSETVFVITETFHHLHYEFISGGEKRD
jgi:hypothetical protein